MDIPMNLFYWILGTVPIILLIIFMVILQWSAIKAAPITLVVTIGLGMTIFQGSFSVISVELLRALWGSLSIILVIFSAIVLYEVSYEVNAFKTLNQLFKTIAPNELIRILLIGVVFASFLQGVTGFGVPVLVTAPLLIQIGVKPMWAVIVPLLGHSWAGTFGTLALAWDALMEQVMIESVSLMNSVAFFATAFLAILTLVANFSITYLYGRGKAIKKGFVAVLIITAIQGGGQLLIAQFNPELASFLPSALALIVLILLSRSSLYNEEWAVQESRIMDAKDYELEDEKEHLEMSPFQALIPYILMTLITLTVLLTTPLNNLLNQVSYGPNFPETVTGFGVVNEAVQNYSPFQPLIHASTFLFLAAFLSYLYYKQAGFVKNQHPIKNIFKRTLKRAISPSIAVLSLLAISRVMTGTGQIMVLAEGITAVLGSYYTLFSPFIGLLGSFITGNNMSSNILFGNFQYLTADFIGLNIPAVLGAQTAGGAIGMALAPGNIVLGTSAVNTPGLEGKVMMRIIPFTLFVAAIIGIVLLFIY